MARKAAIIWDGVATSRLNTSSINKIIRDLQFSEKKAQNYFDAYLKVTTKASKIQKKLKAWRRISIVSITWIIILITLIPLYK